MLHTKNSLNHNVVIADMQHRYHTKEEKYIIELMEQLSAKNASRLIVQNCVGSITNMVVQAGFPQAPEGPVILVPILRGGAAMWLIANQIFSGAITSFVCCSKIKGSFEVSSIWLKSSPIENADIIVLDTVIATGDTVVKVCSEAAIRFHPFRSLTVLSCYAAPEGIEKIINSFNNCIRVVVGCMSETLGADGFLIPRINGDMGDKLFGS